MIERQVFVFVFMVSLEVERKQSRTAVIFKRMSGPLKCRKDGMSEDKRQMESV